MALLSDPGRQWTVSELARRVDRSAGGVSERLRALREAGLVDRRNSPLIPALFWELVNPWHQRPIGLGSFPGIVGPFPQLSWLGLPADWVLTDTQAALLLGAPVIASAEGPPDFYVPQQSIADAAVSHFGPARGRPVRRSDPSAMLASIRTSRSGEHHRVSVSPIPSSLRSTSRTIGRGVERSWRPGTRLPSEWSVSGESVVLVAEVDSVPYRAVGRLAEVAPRLPPFALIGGFAIIVRLGQTHRATNDVDTVSDDQPGLLQALVTDGLERIGDSVMLDRDPQGGRDRCERG